MYGIEKALSTWIPDVLPKIYGNILQQLQLLEFCAEGSVRLWHRRPQHTTFWINYIMIFVLPEISESIQ